MLRKNGPPPPNPSFQTTEVHLAGVQMKRRAEAEGYNLDAVGILLICGGHGMILVQFCSSIT